MRHLSVQVGQIGPLGNYSAFSLEYTSHFLIRSFSGPAKSLESKVELLFKNWAILANDDRKKLSIREKKRKTIHGIDGSVASMLLDFVNNGLIFLFFLGRKRIEDGILFLFNKFCRLSNSFTNSVYLTVDYPFIKLQFRIV